jgi:2-dehydropantoate 2-reductase
MKIAILGAGALGSVIGAELFKAGLDVVLLDKDPAHIAAIRNNGLKVDWDDRQEHLMIPAMEPESTQAVDLVILLTKTLHSQAALRSIKPILDAGAFVLTLQNGLGNIETILPLVPPSQILFGCTMTPGDLRGPGHVASHGMAFTPYDTYQDVSLPETLIEALKKGGMTRSTQALEHVWQKAAFNCAMNAVAALGEGIVDDIAHFIGPSLVTNIADEVVAVAQKDGITLDSGSIAKQIAFALANQGGHKPSMLQDIEAHRPTEIDALNGYIAQRGHELGVKVPLNSLLSGLIKMKEKSQS